MKHLVFLLVPVTPHQWVFIFYPIEDQVVYRVLSSWSLWVCVMIFLNTEIKVQGHHRDFYDFTPWC